MNKISRSAIFEMYFSTLLINFHKKGINWVAKRLIIRALIEISWVILLPISIILHFAGFRQLPVRIEHIGHLATEIDTFIKARNLGLVSEKYYFVLAPYNKVSNHHLLNYWRSFVKIITNVYMCQFLGILAHRYFMHDRVTIHRVGFFGTQPIYKVNKLWGERSPLLCLNAEDSDWAMNKLPELGISQDKWFVCLHIREGGFLPNNEHIQSHRNASISNTFLAIEEIVKRGGLVIRMGDSSMLPLPALEGVIDYAHHPFKSDRMDVVLCAKAKFFLGCTSGLAFLSSVFGVPVAHANMIPLETLGIRYTDLSIPKLLYHQSDVKPMQFKEIFSSEIGGYFFSYQYTKAKIRFEENSSDEILFMTKEMLDRLEGKFIESDEDRELHEKYQSFFKSGHYSYEAASRLCVAFLQKHKELIV